MIWKNHLDFVHQQLRDFIQAGDIVIDATCGNGHDLLFLSSLVFSPEKKGKVIAIDLQKQAMESSHHLLQDAARDIEFHHRCHSHLGEIASLVRGNVKAVIYNLGYLPGSDKSVKTQVETTLISIGQAIDLLMQGGRVFITAYRGHEGGNEEFVAIREFAQQLCIKKWQVWQLSSSNRLLSPVVFMLIKK